MTEPTSDSDRAITDADPGEAQTEAPLTTDDEAQQDESVINSANEAG
jgi:hypothetical protein